MEYDFDTIINRKNTDSLKYDFWKVRGHAEDELPMWVADMDFQTAPEIVDALVEVANRGIYGYSDGLEDYNEAVEGWFSRHYNWEIQGNWIVKTPGVVFALAAAIQAFTEKGEGVLIQQPVYYPFSETIVDSGRVVVNSPLVYDGKRYTMDYADLEQKIIAQKVKLMLFCSPHNPVGRVWSREELVKLGGICLRHGVTVFSDEIHADFVYDGRRHVPLASISKELADITVTGTAPSKTFNLAGLQISNIMISNKNLRDRYKQTVNAFGYSQPGVMGMTACRAAYTYGESWYQELLPYLQKNRDFFVDYIQKEIPELSVVIPGGTYLVWVDFRQLGLSEEALNKLIREKAKLWLDSGAIFGPEGEGFQRFNIACPRKVLQQALDQLKDAIYSAN